MVNLFPPITEILPHRAGMLLIESIDSFDENGVQVCALPRSDAWYADAHGNMPAWIGIELMAQAVAAWVGLTMRLAGQAVKQGVLLGTRSYSADQPVFFASEPLAIKAVPIYRDESGMGSFSCEIWQKGQPIASAAINVFEPEDFKVFLQRGK